MPQRGHLGYLVVASPDAATFERDTFTCNHCNRVVLIEPGKKDATWGSCWNCTELICEHCVKAGKCDPWEKQIEAMEARGRMLQAILG